MDIITKPEALEIISEITLIIDNNLNSILPLRNQKTIKDDNTPVTKADIMLENLIKTHLKSKYPDLCFIGEETYSDTELKKFSNCFIAILDPIDGTENFTSGLREWGVTLTLWNCGEHLASMIYIPEMGLQLKTGERIDKHESRIIGLSSSINQAFREILEDGKQFRISGCAAFNLYNVITGRFQRFINPKGAYTWDLLAGLMLALEHGCSVKVDGKKYEGHFLDPNRTHTVDIENK